MIAVSGGGYVAACQASTRHAGRLPAGARVHV